MTKLEKLSFLQRLRDVAKAVSVAGNIPTAPFSPIVISIICEMQLYPVGWMSDLDKEIEKLGGQSEM